MDSLSPIHTTLLAIALAGAIGLAAGCGADDEEPIPWVGEQTNQENQANQANQANQEDQNGNDEQPLNEAVVKLLDQVIPLSLGSSASITFEAPENVVSLMVNVTDGPADGQYAVSDWVGPDDFVLVPNGWERFSQSGICFPDCNNRILLNQASFGALAPNNPDSQVAPGTYRLKVVGMTMSGNPFMPQVSPMSGEVRLTVYAKVASSLPEEGILDLNIFFSGTQGWTAESAKDDPDFQALLDRVEAIYDQVNIKLGQISYNDIDSRFQVIEDVMGGDGDLGELFSLSEHAPLEGPSLFLVDELRNAMFGGGGAILGISGGIPGAAIIDGTYRSGVAVAVDSTLQMGPQASLEHVIGHELGHYLGLFHTTEQMAFPGMPGHDPLPDTAENDPSYLMHATGGGIKMSPWQGKVMRANPWTRHD